MVFRKMLDGLKSAGIDRRISPTGMFPTIWIVYFGRMIANLALPPPPPMGNPRFNFPPY